MRRLLLIAIAAAAAAGAEPPEERGAAGLRQTLKRLENPYRVMQIVAHPDDEDGGVLTYLSRGLGAEVTLVSITRGESGANQLTGDFFDRLGALRTLEYFESARHYGVRPQFTRFADFGFSKSLEETLRNWDRGELVGDLVRLIREERPHVVIAKWRGGPRDGHGQHQAAGLVAVEAARAAGDPTRYPEQIRDGLAPWRPLKIYSGNRREDEDWTVRIDAGVSDPILGRTYEQIARDGLRRQRSQGAGAAEAGAGPAPRLYKLVESTVGSAEKESGFFDRMNEALPPALAAAVRDATREFDVDRPQAVIPALARGLAAARQAGEPWTRRAALFEQALALAAGVSFSANVEPDEPSDGPPSAFLPRETFAVAVAGQSFTVATLFHAGSGAARLVRLNPIAPEGWAVASLDGGRFRFTAPLQIEPTRAYWRRDSPWDVVYELTDPKLFGLPRTPPPLRVQAAYAVGGVEAVVEAPVRASRLDRFGIQRRRDLVAGPAVSVEFPAEAAILPLRATVQEVSVRIRNHAARELSGRLRLILPEGWRADPAERGFSFTRQDERREARFRVSPAGELRPGDYALEAEAEYEGRRTRESFERVSYDDLEAIYLARPARLVARAVDVSLAAGLRVGYLMGTGDDVPQALRVLGAAVEMLDAAALAESDLARFDTIVLGIRAYAARPELKTHNHRLLEYVERGGVLIVQYNTPEFDENFGPYPYVMGRRPEETAEEDAPVRILAPEHAVFQWPNRITEADFDGWVEQRGSKFLTEWDERYQPMIETHDSDQAPQRGVWLTARHGRGLYVYCAPAWYRQLPHAVPGAARIFANLVSLGSPEAPWRR